MDKRHYIGKELLAGANALMLWLDSQGFDCPNGAAICCAALAAQLREMQVSERCVDELLASIKARVMA